MGKEAGGESMVERRLMDSGDIVGREIDRKNGDGDLSTSQHIAKNMRQFFSLGKRDSNHLLRVDDYYFKIANCVSCVLGVEDRRNMEKELLLILEDLSISLSLNPSLCYKVSLEELKSCWILILFKNFNEMRQRALENPFKNLLLNQLMNYSSSREEGDAKENPRNQALLRPNVNGRSCYWSRDNASLVKLKIVGFALEIDRNTCLHHNINEKEETYHGVRMPMRRCWRKTNLMLWRFDNEFFFKPISSLPCVFLQRLKIVLRIEFLLCDFGWELYG
ncbi:hypothetical protein M9H77_22784 [Catharanthus roseus]|uniref:Uncharacterized protein n=1 Tax=Catharanthus roseus TaxID=4058 RepID=A0ACC0ARV1_CATRO|nr:hypothetical protein M9H77_22784 [Catharanthus roseus]